jgi:hypothetical protein
MKLDFRSLRSIGAALLVGALSLCSAGCGDDPAPAPPPPRYAPITVFNGITDVQSIQFKIGETILAGNAAFGNPVTVTQALVGSQTEVKVLTTTGTQLSSAKVAIDTGRSVWVIAAGEAIAGKTPSIFGISSQELPPSATRATIRIINASADLGKIDVHETEATGLLFANDLDYKGASDFFSVPTTVDKLSVTGSDNTTEKLSINVAPPLEAGKVYNVIIYGTTNVDAQTALKVQGKIVPEP